MKTWITVLFILVASSNSFAAGKSCSDLIVATAADVAAGKNARKKMAADLKKWGLDKHAYVAHWDIPKVENAGPFLQEGETLVLGLETEDYDLWYEKIGKRSIGLMLNGLPEENPGSAFIRIGNVWMSDAVIQDPKELRDLRRTIRNFTAKKGLTEVTFLVSEEEMSAIMEFFMERRSRKIRAQFETREGLKPGEKLKPKYAHTGDDLLLESCAMACTSFVADQWLDHYEKAEVLRQIRQRLGLNSTFVARRMLWENFRNPKAAMMTEFRVDRSAKGLKNDFMANNGWGHIRGLYPYAYIPDGGVKHETSKYKSWRQSLADYLAKD